jgi:molecular chaperone DnaJ
MSVESFYDILGVTESSSQDEIKKAYKKKAVEHHPDKGGDEEVFKKISQAYDTLGDENKRRDYNNQKNNPFGQGGGFNPFEDFFNGQFGQQFAQQRVVPDKVVDVNIGALESYLSFDKVITYNRRVECQTCRGQGGERINCNKCQGQGFTTTRVGNGMFIQMVRQTCGACVGKGFSYKTRCGTCSGECTVPSFENISVKLPHGVDDGQFFKLQGKGDYKSGVYGNLVLRVKINPENNFEKSGNDLIYNSYFDLERLNSESFVIPHPDGPIEIKMPADFDTSKPLRVKAKGFNTNGVGDLYVKLIVKFRKEK